MKVLKFGGSSVGKPESIIKIGDILSKRILQNNEKLSVVCSAFGGITDLLIGMAHEASEGKDGYISNLEMIINRHYETITNLGIDNEATEIYFNEIYTTLTNLLKGILLVREASPRTMDYVLSFGERSSNFIVAEYLKTLEINAAYLDARDIIITNRAFGKAVVNFEITYPKIKNYISSKPDVTHVITGFIASDIGGLTTTLGRGGSDYTASIISGALDAESLEIWTDVDGVLTSDPRVVKKAYTIPYLTYDEAMELANMGAKVIYPPTIQPALEKDIPIFIKNTFNPDFIGTRIGREKKDKVKKTVTGLTSIKNVSLLTLEGTGMYGVPGTAARYFKALADKEINIIMITQASSEHSICAAMKMNDVKSALSAVRKEFKNELESGFLKEPIIENELCALAIVGEQMRSIPGVAGRLFESLGKNGINVIAIAQGSSELNISFIIKGRNRIKALNLIHDSFFLSDKRKLNVYMAGTGLIGKTLLYQINAQKDHLASSKNLDISIVGLANSKKYIIDVEGIDLNNWEKLLSASDKSMNIETYLKDIYKSNLSQSVFVDCTADKNIPTYYDDILSKNISISTPNKVAASSSYDYFKKLKALSVAKNVDFRIETNVGAGLPIIETLQGLVDSGDKVNTIKAVLSGSLSFIFNNYTSDKSFAEVVSIAREKGFTEPDPREDLSGQDVKRKILILSRIAGYPLEPEDVTVEALLPEKCMRAKSVDAFMKELDNHEDYFRSLVNNAKKEQSRLRYIASLEGGKAKITLEKVKNDDPFYNLASTDNMAVFYTARYKERPLVIQGPGAGAEVTAAGVFAELIKMGGY
ncbi:MAG: bifunctional aspartate kinase/homoserine dehydrogenase I [Saprospiraceae bacterium]